MIYSPQNKTVAPMKKRNFSAEFKRESAQLVVDQNYMVADAAKAMDVGLSTVTRWVKNCVMSVRAKPDQAEYEPARKLLG